MIRFDKDTLASLLDHMNCKIDLDINPKPDDIDILQQGLNDYNAVKLNERPQEFAIYLRDDQGNICGGITALEFSDSVHISLLWVDEPLRTNGYGSLLLEALENEVINKRLQYAYVDTFGFQGDTFYSNRGYELIGRIESALLGHPRLFFRKKL